MQISNDIQMFLSLTNDAIHPEQEVTCSYKNVDWEELCKLALKNNMLPVLYPSIEKKAKEETIPENIYSYWKRSALACTVGQYKQYYAIRKIIEEANKNKVNLIFFKGCILADLYPQYTLRTSCDTDIFVSDEEEEKADQLLTKLGYTLNEKKSKQKVKVYFSKEFNHMIELHTSLFEELKGPKIDLLEKMKLTDPSSFIEQEACGMKLKTLGYTEHLIYQFFHIIKHFSLQGITMRYIADITLFIERYKEKIDFTRFWNCINKLEYKTFVETFIWICIEYFGLSEDVFAGIKHKKPKDISELLLDLVTVGITYDEHTAGWQLLGIMTPYLVGETNYSKHKCVRKLRVMFPSSKAMSEDYNYAKKHKILLPIAWIHRGVNFGVGKYRNKEEWYDVSEKLKVAEHRISLMNGLGLLDDK